MRTDDFRAWLSGQGLASGSVSTRIADARRIEANYGDLDEAFEGDSLEGILSALAYSSADKAAGRPNPSGLEINGDLYDGLATYRAAVTAYKKFAAGEGGGGALGPNPRRLSLSLLTSRDAVLEAISEYDALGRWGFLQKYGFGPAKSYLIHQNGKTYDSKAIAGVAVGKQHPAIGPMTSGDFTGGESVKAKLMALGFEFVTENKISSADVALIRQSRLKGKFADLDEAEREAYSRVTAALNGLGALVLGALGETGYSLRLTSGFHLQSGVRGSIPKDIWFGIYANANKDLFAGSPQLFMIVSERGIEFGFAASTHPSGFSNGEIKALVRSAAPKVFAQLPAPRSSEAVALEETLIKSGGWHYRRQTRLVPNQDDFGDLEKWLRFQQSPQGIAEAGGSISRYVLESEVDDRDLGAELIEMADIFRPLMEEIRADGSAPAVVAIDTPPQSTDTFAELTSEFLAQYGIAGQGPYGVIKPLWEAASNLHQWLKLSPPVQKRSHMIVRWSAGKGVWARVPWFAIMNQNITTTTQKGLYCVFLVAEDLSAVYLALAQGVTEVVEELGVAGASKVLEQRATEFRSKARQLEDHGFTLANDIDLKCDGNLAKNYQKSTIAYVRLDTAELPDDTRITGYLEALMAAYDELSKTEAVEAVFDDASKEEHQPPLPPYTIADAMDGLFMAQSEFERILSIWNLKKNLVLQGAPGVGKSFVAKRLAYALIGARDPKRVEMVQFHQSYGYEDFVQGYRPDGAGGFVLRAGIFYEFCERARKFPEQSYVFIIDEINRGNLSKIFGELMLLIEADKRSPDWAARLSYSSPTDPSFYVPSNVFIIGMMNTADRSLSLVDYALRRRFGFVTLEPQFQSPTFRQALLVSAVDDSTINRISQRMTDLNEVIAGDVVNLGRGFRIGHSFFVPTQEVEDPVAWYRLVVETEIRPLLEEYWLDNLDKVEGCCNQLTSGIT